MRYYFIFLLLPTLSNAQYKNYNTENAKWYKGEVVLNDGQLIQGDIIYNFVDNSLKIKTGEEELYYTSRKVSQFSLQDSVGTVNKYYSLLHDMNGFGDKVPYFFKVIYENDYVALLSKKEFEFKRQRQVYTAGLNNFFAYLRLIKYLESVQENIYIANTDGNIYHFLASNKIKISSYELDFDQMISYNNKEVSERKKNAKIKYHIERVNALELIFRDNKQEIKSYISESKLDVKELEDLIKICFYYSELQ